jgi:CheY-like chemotaxis protein
MSAQVKKVLVVDDDPVVGKSFNRVLTQQGYVVVTASNGHEALSKLQDGDYDCVFTDIRMPGMDGLELAEQVHARKSWTPVVIVTGYGTTANEERAKAAGVTAFLQKPVTPEMLEATARDAMARPAPVIARGEIAKTIETVHAEVHGAEGNLKKVGLLVAAPFAALAFVFVGPFVALAALVGMAMMAIAKETTLRGALTFATNVAKFVAAPFIGLAFIVVGPVVGFAVLSTMLIKAVAQKVLPLKLRTFLRNAALFFAAPFIGLAYILALPVVGMATLGWMVFRGKNNKPATN